MEQVAKVSGEILELQHNCCKCNDIGFIETIVDEYSYIKKCVCKIKEENFERLRISGLFEYAKKNTFEKFITKSEEQKMVKNKALNFLKQNNYPFFFIGGQVGAGKTHICTAIALELINKGKPVKYVMYRDMVINLKSKINDDNGGYEKLAKEYKNIPVLYIDDLFKTKTEEKPTDADIRCVFEIINDRYMRNKITIISSEKNIYEILEIDEAIGSRITEKAKEYAVTIDINPNKNYRIYGH